MNRLVVLVSLFSLLSCQNAPQQQLGVDDKKTVSVSVDTLKKYSSVRKMLYDADDFSESNNTLKILSDTPLHIQVSKYMVDGDLEEVIIEQTKRDIIYVLFQSFAQTNIEKIKITSVPLKLNTKKTVDKYKVTIEVTREKALSILKKYLNSDKFAILYVLFGEKDKIWVPSKEFDVLKFKQLDNVFKDLSEK